MEHCAIDLGGRKSQVCIRRNDGTILHESRCETSSLKSWLQELPQLRVVMETCAEAFGIADAALAAGHEVRWCRATLVRSLGVGARRNKTDRRDAQVLSEVSCRIDLPSVHVPSKRSRERKTICGMREALVGCRTKLINNVRGSPSGVVLGPGPGRVVELRDEAAAFDHQSGAASAALGAGAGSVVPAHQLPLSRSAAAAALGQRGGEAPRPQGGDSRAGAQAGRNPLPSGGTGRHTTRRALRADTSRRTTAVQRR